MIFVANIVYSYVLIDVMMTRSDLEEILGVKTWNNHGKLPRHANFPSELALKNSHNFTLIWLILMIFVANMVIS